MLLLVLVVLASLAIGARDISPAGVFEALFAPDVSVADHVVVQELRIPRTVLGVLAGAAFGIAGALIQGITRNPLADPGLLGVNAGASLFVVIGITWFGAATALGFIWFALAGAATAAVAVYAVGSIGREGATPVKLALTGAALTAALTSLLTILLLADLETLDRFRFWTVGSLVGRGLETAAALAPFLLVGAVLAAVGAKTLNALALGDDLARGLGQNIPIARAVTGAAVVLLCGAGTALAGPVVFVGLVVPHAARWIAGPDYRWILAYSALLGPVLMLVADVLGRLVLRPGELEVGIVVAFLGAPLLIALVRRTKLAAL
ncbi:FecCD family ABC transporter permease [Lysobacter korlensis]|uniref:FecCD family ABC transporter permease n=1 Tax=Lysobacter korlensis TaxID=553636 RepID=A0ABV6RW14_9GAMM